MLFLSSWLAQHSKLFMAAAHSIYLIVLLRGAGKLALAFVLFLLRLVFLPWRCWPDYPVSVVVIFFAAGLSCVLTALAGELLS